MTLENHFQAVVIGGGAAGMFAAITCAENLPGGRRVALLEKTQHLLSKVKISGGGRCNVTHFCFDPSELVKNYPRGGKELRGPFSRFQPKDTIEWFGKRGVEIKNESDGRMFPITDDSRTIIDCLVKAANGVQIMRGKSVQAIVRDGGEFHVTLKTGEVIVSQYVLLATGSASQGHALAKELGHTIVETVPSLFTFNIPDSPLHELAGISVEHARVSLPEFRAEYYGPLLITHWGFSGPAVLKLSSFCARELHLAGYEASCNIDWLPDLSNEGLKEMIREKKEGGNKKSVFNDPLSLTLPRQLWKALAMNCGITEDARWVNLSKAQAEKLIEKVKADSYKISGKTTYKQEFVTCGGIKLAEVNFQTMESKIVPGLFFAGEILDIDGITGGFNFQAAWTTGWIAGKAMSQQK